MGYYQCSGLIDDFILNGGFTKIESDLLEKFEISLVKENLENGYLKSQNKDFKYKKSNREMAEQISKLTRDNLRFGNWDIRFR